MRKGFVVVFFAAGLAGCAAGAQDKEQRAFGESFTWEWRGIDPAAASASAKPAATPARAGASGQEALDREFEDWRAWQEWKRKNPK